jgi:hypothetical protein
VRPEEFLARHWLRSIYSFPFFSLPPAIRQNLRCILLAFIRRVWSVLAGWLGVRAAFYLRVEGLRPLDAVLRVHPHSIEYRIVHKSTTIFAIFVYPGVFTLQN